MIVNIGGGISNVAVLSMGGVVVSDNIPVGGDRFDQAIMNYVRRRYGDYPQNKWDINLAIKAHFEALAGRDIYDIVGQPTARR